MTNASPLHTTLHGPPEAPLLVLLHGGGVAGWMWDAQVPVFSQTHRVLVIDLPGHGGSAEVPFTTLEQAGRLVSQAIAAEEPDCGVTLVGFSLGAQLAVDLLSREPGLAQAAMIVSALAERLPGAGWARPMARWSLPLARWRPFAKLQARSLEVPPHQFEAYYRDTFRLTAESFGNLMAENMRFTIPAQWAATQARVALVVGARERAVMRRSAQALHAALPSSQLTVVPGAGHGLPLQQPERFNGLLRTFLVP